MSVLTFFLLIIAIIIGTAIGAFVFTISIVGLAKFIQHLGNDKEEEEEDEEK